MSAETASANRRPVPLWGRKRIVEAHSAGLSIPMIAGKYVVSVSTVKSIVSEWQAFGVVDEPKPGSGPKKNGAGLVFAGPSGMTNLRALELLKEGGDDDELLTDFYQRYVNDANRVGPPASYSAVTAALRDLGYTGKRLTKEANERDSAACDAWQANVKRNFNSRQLICVDEVGTDKKCTNRNRGHSKRGQRAIGKQHFHKGPRYSALGVFTYDDAFIDADIVKGGYNKRRLLRGAKAALLPHLNAYPGERSVVVWDGASIHSHRELISMIFDLGALVLFLEPYDPQHMPIEIGFRSVKGWMRRKRDLIEDMPQREQLRMRHGPHDGAQARREELLPGVRVRRGVRPRLHHTSKNKNNQRAAAPHRARAGARGAPPSFDHGVGNE